MISRRRVVLSIGASALTSAFASLAQDRPGKVHRIGFVGVASAAEMAPRVEGLRAGLRELGYIEGKNFVIEYRYADGISERLTALAAELARLNVELIVTHAAGVRAAQQATNTIPIVSAASGDPIASGVTTSLARPSGNVTGVVFFSEQRVGAVTLPDTPIVTTNSKELADLALKHRLPSAGNPGFAEAGGMLGYGVSLDELFRRSAAYVDKILRGAKPGDLPIEQPTKFNFVINMKTAKALGIKVPQSILLQATKVIE